jgi:GNAT superfamily N-acetyltransferase
VSDRGAPIGGGGWTIRVTTGADAPAVARLVNDAFKIEAFFKIGDRTSDDEVRRLMASGEFLALEDRGGLLAACVYVKIRGDRGYFGMLSVAPSMQRRGLGRRMIEDVEARCQARGCRYVDIHLVNLREELPAFYRRLGYAENGTLPFPDADRATRDCHFIVMTKELGREG